MTGIQLEVLEHRGRVANHGALGLVFVCFWLQWLLPDAQFAAGTLTGFHLPGLLTHPFIHGHSLHLIWNLLMLHVFGGLVCNALGPTRYVGAWLAFTLAGATGHLLAGGGQAAGASGVIAGFTALAIAARLTGAVALLDGAVRVRTDWLALALVAKDIVFAFLPGMGVSVAGHAGGYVAGGLVGALAWGRHRRN
jgi:membrane associated rhomboid family serine protease